MAEDHPLMRKGIAAMIAAEPDLELCGEAEDCATATSEVARLVPDVVIVDISLKGTSGIELIKNIKMYNAKIEIVVLSIHDESVYALRVLKAGAKGYVMKEDVATKVIEAVRMIRVGQVFVSKQIEGQIFENFFSGREREHESAIEGLSDRELEIVTLIGAGLATREIAARLRVSVKTIETHRSHIKTKIKAKTACKLTQFCVQWVERSNMRLASEPAESETAPG